MRSTAAAARGSRGAPAVGGRLGRRGEPRRGGAGGPWGGMVAPSGVGRPVGCLQAGALPGTRLLQQTRPWKAEGPASAKKKKRRGGRGRHQGRSRVAAVWGAQQQWLRAVRRQPAARQGAGGHGGVIPRPQPPPSPVHEAGHSPPRPVHGNVQRQAAATAVEWSVGRRRVYAGSGPSRIPSQTRDDRSKWGGGSPRRCRC